MDVKNHTAAELEAIRNALPYRYATTIASKIEGVTPRDVRRVFSGQLKKPAIVLPVLEEAWRLYEEIKRANQNINKLAQMVSAA